MADPIDHDRRRFLGIAGLTIAAAHLGLYKVVNGNLGGPNDLEGIGRATAWLNSRPLRPSAMAGKVVLVDFCTYTCINWLRTLPYRRAWAQKYQPHLVIIGVHTPEFSFERNLDNVRRALQQLHVEYPIAIDNDYAIWRAFSNQYWPALYFVDAHGAVRDHHFGEGAYEESERSIQRLLGKPGALRRDGPLVAAAGAGVEAAPDWGNLKSPEKYLGTARTDSFASPGGAQRDRRRLYAAPPRMSLNKWALVGEWTMRGEAALLGSPRGRIVCRFHARDVHLVLTPPQGGERVRFRVTIDGRAPGADHGADANADGSGVVVEPRLYQLIRQTGAIVDRQFEIEFLDAGVEAFAFTFG